MSVRLMKMLSNTGPIISFGSVQAEDSGPEPATVSTDIEIRRDGSIHIEEGGLNTIHSYWMNESNRTSTVGDAYEVMFTLTLGDLPSGVTMNTWYTISSTRKISYSENTQGNTSGNGTVTIRLIANNNLSSSGTWSMNVDVDSPE